MSGRSKRPGRDGLLAVATRLFAEQGVHATSLQQIAAAAKVTKAALYHHYRTKDEIVAAVLDPAVAVLHALMERARDTADVDARTTLVIVGLADQAVSHRELWSILLQDGAAATVLAQNPDHADLMDALHTSLAGPDPDDRRLLAVAMFLSGLIGPAMDPTCAHLSDAVLREGVIDAGRRLLDDPRPGSSPRP